MQGDGTTIRSVNAFPTGSLTIFNPKFRGRGHVFPWANAFVGRSQSKFEAPVKKSSGQGSWKHINYVCSASSLESKLFYFMS